MKYLIKTMSLYGDGILNENSCGTVHSVYRKTVNLSLGGRLLALQPYGSPMSPVSLLIQVSEKEFECLGIRAGDRVIVTEGAVEIKDVAFSGESFQFLRCGANRKDLRMVKALDPLRIGEIIKELEGKLSAKQTMPYLAADIAKKWVNEAEKQIGEGEWDEAADSLCRLIGLGIGLTPGGDDFLCGVLAGIILGDACSHPFADTFRNKIAEGIGRTNDISRIFLMCALEGQFGPDVHAFYEEPAETILNGMRRIGHTSGIDTLQGILYAFRLCKKLKPEEAGRK